MDSCCVVQIYELSALSPAVRELLRKQVFSQALIPKGGSLSALEEQAPCLFPGRLIPVEMDTFVCRSREKAHDLMLDAGLHPVDWICCREESDAEGKVLEIFLSTDGGYLCRILRTPLL
ncbi:MAG: hypothetical protein ACC613_04060 [Synergistales bacterium]